ALETSAVAGMTMPPRDRRSPRRSGICTSTRSLSILIGCLASLATLRKYRLPGMAIEPLTLKTSDGLALEAELHAPDDAWAGAVIAHPHPQFGGTMRSIVIGTLFAALPQAGVTASWKNARLETVAGADHYFVGRTDRLAPLCLELLKQLRDRQP